jgi:hypothetical protein
MLVSPCCEHSTVQFRAWSDFSCDAQCRSEYSEDEGRLVGSRRGGRGTDQPMNSEFNVCSLRVSRGLLEIILSRLLI